MVHPRGALILLFVGVGVAILAGGPLATKVLDVKKDGVWIAAGSAEGVCEGDEFEVYGPREVVYLPLLGKEEEVVVEKGAVARLAVRKVFENKALCEVVEGKRDEVKVGMTVVRVPPKQRTARNITPYIDSFSAIPTKVVPGKTVLLKCKVTDPDDKEHLFVWRATGGRLYPSQTTLPRTRWLPPARPGKYALTVVVSDRKGAKTTATITVQVVRPETPPAAYKIDAIFSTVRPPFMAVLAVDFDENGRLVLLDPKQRKLVIFDYDGVALRTTLPYGEKQRITGLRIANGRYFLSDASGCCVLVYEREEDIFKARPSLILGHPGTGNGYFSTAPVVDVGPNGRIYCLDPVQGFIQVFNSDGSFLRSIGRRGTEPDAFNRPVSICFDRRGLLYVLDCGRKEILIFKDDLFQGPLVTREPLVQPVWMYYDRVGDRLVVLDVGEGALRVLTTKGEEVGRIEGKGFGALRAWRFAVGPDGSVVVVCGGKVLLRYSLKTGSFRGAIGLVDLWPLKEIAVQPNGSFFVLFGENKIAHLTDDGWILKVFGGEGRSVGRFYDPVAMGCDSRGNLYVADDSTLLVTKFDADGNFQKRFGVKGKVRAERIDSIIDIYVRGDRIYLLQDRETYCVFVFNPDGELLARYPSRDGRIEYPAAVAVDSNGNTYIYSERPDIVRYDRSGLRAGSVTFIKRYLADIAMDNCDQIVALDEDRPFLVLIDPASGVRYLPLPANLFVSPIRVALDKFGRVYILDEDTGCVVRLRPLTE